jgi:hypothetical protein
VFPDRLRIELSFAIDGAAAVVSGAIERLEVAMEPYGFEAEATFRISSEQDADPLFASFTGQALIWATLRVNTCVLDGTGDSAPPVAMTGVVVERAVREQVGVDVAGEPVVDRAYRVRLVDPLAAFWREHRPIELFTEASLKDILEQYKPPGVTLTHDLTAFQQKRAMLCVSAGGEGPASFYDALLWLVDASAGVIELDADTNTYRIADRKASAAGEPLALDRESVAAVTVRLPPPPRHAGRVRNGSTEAADTEEAASAQAAAGVYREALVRSPLTSVADDRAALEKRRLAPPGHELDVRFGRAPPQLLGPGRFAALGEGWSGQLATAGQAYRVLALRLSAGPDEGAPFTELESPVKAFSVAIAARMELSTSPRRSLPPYAPPRYPVLVEGRVVSLGGEAVDRTWMAAESDESSVASFEIDIPLWNKRVSAPFEPGHGPGHFFFAPYKAQRVLVALELGGAGVRAFLDWAVDAPLPKEGQGDRLVLGKRAPIGTIVQHAYEGDGTPTLTVQRVAGQDKQTIVIKEGTIWIEVKEDETAQAIEPVYDVQVVVAAAQAQVSTAVDGAVGGLTGAFSGAMGGVTGSLEGAIGDMSAAVAGAEAKLLAALAAALGTIETLAAGVAASAQQISDAVASSKANLQAAVS